MNKPQVTDRASWQAKLDALLVKEKAHTRAGDSLAAERRRLPMVEVDASARLVGARGEVPLLEVFEGRAQLLVYFHMWHRGKPAPEQCEGCTFFTTHVQELSYLHSRDITFATFCEGPYEESARYHDFMGWKQPWYSVPEGSRQPLLSERHFGLLVAYLRDGNKVYETYANSGRGVELMAPSYGLMDVAIYGRQETWEKSPDGWPQTFDASRGAQFRKDGRPTAQWERLADGKGDDLGATEPSGGGGCCGAHDAK